MRELSLNILDIAKNSTKAKAKLVTIKVVADEQKDSLIISIADDGVGMSEEFLQNVVDPFTTTRTTRKVGMGIPLFKEACETTGGYFEIQSSLGVGTITTGHMVLSSIDRMPLGNLADTMAILIMGSGDVEFVLEFDVNDESFNFDTREVKEMIGESDLTAPSVISYLKEYIEENITILNGGKI